MRELGVEEKVFTYKGFMPFYVTLFSGFFSFMILSFFLPGWIQGFSGIFKDEIGVGFSIFELILTVFNPLIFLLVTFTFMLPKFFVGGYFFNHPKAYLEIKHNGVRVFLSFQRACKLGRN